MNKAVCVIIPNYNGSSTIGKCLEGVFSANFDALEVIVVDDASTDNSVEVINNFPCKLIRLDKHSGASRARNTGAENSKGEFLLFIDADCILQKNSISVALNTIAGQKDAIVGGTYTKMPYDKDFFSAFQSIFINYFETKSAEPDYIATHAMFISSEVFKNSGGFSEDFLPILEDVEFCHRLRSSGHKLIMNPDLLVQHIFNFSVLKSLRNAFRKSKFWFIYSLYNKDLFADSGTASIQLKTNVVAFYFNAFLICLAFSSWNSVPLFIVPLILIFNLFINRGLIKSFQQTKGTLFAIAATTYYMTLYPIAVGAGTIAGVLHYLFKKGK